MRTAKQNSGFLPVRHPAPDPKPEGEAIVFSKPGFEVHKDDTTIYTEEEFRGDTTIAFFDDDDLVAPIMQETGGITFDGSFKVPDAPSTIPATVVDSLFQQDSSALRMVLHLMWNFRSAYQHGSVGHLSAVN